MAEDLAEKQAEYYREVSAKTSANIEDLFNKIIDDLLASSKKKEPVAQNLNEPEKSNPQN
jgi:GTPase SAR1 family protein